MYMHVSPWGGNARRSDGGLVQGHLLMMKDKVYADEVKLVFHTMTSHTKKIIEDRIKYDFSNLDDRVEVILDHGDAWYEAGRSGTSTGKYQFYSPVNPGGKL